MHYGTAENNQFSWGSFTVCVVMSLKTSGGFIPQDKYNRGCSVAVTQQHIDVLFCARVCNITFTMFAVVDVLTRCMLPLTQCTNCNCLHLYVNKPRLPLSWRRTIRECIFSDARMTLNLTSWPWYSSNSTLTQMFWRCTCLLSSFKFQVSRSKYFKVIRARTGHTDIGLLFAMWPCPFWPSR